MMIIMIVLILNSHLKIEKTDKNLYASGTDRPIMAISKVKEFEIIGSFHPFKSLPMISFSLTDTQSTSGNTEVAKKKNPIQIF